MKKVRATVMIIGYDERIITLADIPPGTVGYCGRYAFDRKTGELDLDSQYLSSPIPKETIPIERMGDGEYRVYLTIDNYTANESDVCPSCHGNPSGKPADIKLPWNGGCDMCMGSGWIVLEREHKE